MNGHDSTGQLGVICKLFTLMLDLTQRHTCSNHQLVGSRGEVVQGLHRLRWENQPGVDRLLESGFYVHKKCM